MAAFEGRMNDREEVEVARLLEDSVGSMSLNDSAANSNSPARYVMACHALLSVIYVIKAGPGAADPSFASCEQYNTIHTLSALVH